MSTLASSTRTLKIATRGSLLATTQAGIVRDALMSQGCPAELVIIKTRGDVTTLPVSRLGVGLFTTEIRNALAERQVDIAVHSFKDLPTIPDDRFTLAAIPQRESPFDVIVGTPLSACQPGDPPVRIGTGSPRRIAQLRLLARLRNIALDVVPLRGNLDSRIKKVDSGELDAVVVAAAGLQRLGRTEVISQILTAEEMLPAPAQGALAVECRTDDVSTYQIVQTLDDRTSRWQVNAERALLSTLQAGCTAPVGAFAVFTDQTTRNGDVNNRGGHGATAHASKNFTAHSELTLSALVATEDGTTVLRESITGEAQYGIQLGKALAEHFFSSGAQRVLNMPKKGEP